MPHFVVYVFPPDGLRHLDAKCVVVVAPQTEERLTEGCRGHIGPRNSILPMH